MSTLLSFVRTEPFTNESVGWHIWLTLADSAAIRKLLNTQKEDEQLAMLMD